jgi:hypothetical protein
MHRKLIAGSVAALALAVPSSALATGSCTAKGKRANSQCASQNANTKQVAVAKIGNFAVAPVAMASNNAVTMQALKQKQNSGFLISIPLIAL